MSSALETDVARRTSRITPEVAALVVIFLVTALLAILVPRSGDDWTWGSAIGEQRLTDFFAGYNGRYAGDLMILLLTHAPLLAPVVVAAGVTATIFLILDVTNNRTLSGYAIVAVLYFGMPLDVWRQSVAWLSGFSNYAMSGLAILIYLRAAKRDWTRPAAGRPAVSSLLGIVLVGVVSALFMEHVTIYLVVASLAFVALTRILRGHIPVRGVAWSVSFIIGAAVMFSNGAYRSATQSPSNYQQLGATDGRSFLAEAAGKVADPIAMFMATKNTVAILVLVLAVLALAGVALQRSTRRSPLVVASVAVALLAATYTARATWLARAGTLTYRALLVLAAVLLLSTLCATARALVLDAERRTQIYVSCTSVLLLAGPLLVADPLSPRCFYAGYLMLVSAVSVLLKELLEQQPALARSAVLPLGGIAVASALVVSTLTVYWVIHQAAAGRLDHIRAAAASGATTVHVKALPFNDHVQYADPAGTFWETRYKLFYDIPDSLRIEVSYQH